VNVPKEAAVEEEGALVVSNVAKKGT